MKIMKICAVIALSSVFSFVRYSNATGIEGGKAYWCNLIQDSEKKQRCLEAQK